MCLEGKRSAVLAKIFFNGQRDSADLFACGSTGEKDPFFFFLQ